MGVYSRYDIVDKYLFCQTCQASLHEIYFPSCLGCDDKIGAKNIFGCKCDHKFLCTNHADSHKFIYKDIYIYLCENCVPLFNRQDKQVIKYIDFNLFLIENNMRHGFTNNYNFSISKLNN